jgi:2-polyprenyl-3-methyl-5-hydroxy-6-metoxy-1,4-benzoquinol methylase
VKLGMCARCGFRFFLQRLTGEEEGRLYNAYRGADYVAERNRFEPWYTPALNESIASPENFTKRRAALQRLFQTVLAGRRVRTILDFGGAGGELLNDLIPDTQTYVYDISGSAVVDGAIALRTLAECAEHRFDLVVCSNVLEHVSSPRSFLEEIDRIVDPETLIYLEVPRESPFGLLTLAKRVAQQAILLLKRPRVAIELFRHNFLIQMHEHVNFFGVRSLDRLVGSREWRILDSGVYAVDIYKFGFLSLPASSLVWSLACVPKEEPLGVDEERSRG